MPRHAGLGGLEKLRPGRREGDGGGGRRGGALPPAQVVQPRPHQRAHPPQAARGGRQGRLHGRRRHCRRVDGQRPRPEALARLALPHRRAGGGARAGRLPRQLAPHARQAARRARLLPRPHPLRRHARADVFLVAQAGQRVRPPDVPDDDCRRAEVAQDVLRLLCARRRRARDAGAGRQARRGGRDHHPRPLHRRANDALRRARPLRAPPPARREDVRVPAGDVPLQGHDRRRAVGVGRARRTSTTARSCSTKKPTSTSSMPTLRRRRWRCSSRTKRTRRKSRSPCGRRGRSRRRCSTCSRSRCGARCEGGGTGLGEGGRGQRAAGLQNRPVPLYVPAPRFTARQVRFPLSSLLLPSSPHYGPYPPRSARNVAQPSGGAASGAVPRGCVAAAGPPRGPADWRPGAGGDVQRPPLGGRAGRQRVRARAGHRGAGGDGCRRDRAPGSAPAHRRAGPDRGAGGPARAPRGLRGVAAAPGGRTRQRDPHAAAAGRRARRQPELRAARPAFGARARNRDRARRRAVRGRRGHPPVARRHHAAAAGAGPPGAPEALVPGRAPRRHERLAPLPGHARPRRRLRRCGRRAQRPLSAHVPGPGPDARPRPRVRARCPPRPASGCSTPPTPAAPPITSRSRRTSCSAERPARRKSACCRNDARAGR